MLFLVKLDAHGLKVLKLWGGVGVIGFVAYVAFSHIGASNYRHNAEQQIAKCELKGNGHPHDGNEAYTRLLHAGGGVQV